MKIGIIGTGIVGQTLGTGLIGVGHEVKMGSRHADNPKVQEWVSTAGDKASAGTFAEAAQFGEVVFLCTLWHGTEHALRLAEPHHLAGKVVVDVTNPLNFDSGGPELAVGFSDSAGEMVQRWLPTSHVVKALNIVTAKLMVNPGSLGEMPDMFICGNDDFAKRTVGEILAGFGWPPPIDMGGIQEARLIEPLGMIWIKYFMSVQSGNHAFKLIRK